MILNLVPVCRFQLFEKHGIVKSPSYPDPYPPNFDCAWVIPKPVPGETVLVNFVHLDVRIFCYSSMVFQKPQIKRYLQIEANSDIVTLTTFNDDIIPQEDKVEVINGNDYSSQNIEIHFTTDDSVSGSGFLATYESKKKTNYTRIHLDWTSYYVSLWHCHGTAKRTTGISQKWIVSQ